MEKFIVVTIKSVYGVDTVYPACETAKFFAELAGTKTLTRNSISLIKKHGYSVEVKNTVATL